MFRLKVSSEEMRARAAEAEKSVGEMEKTFGNMLELLQSSGSYWTGEGGERCRKQGKECAGEAAKLCKKMYRSIQALRIMTDVYEQTEAEVHGLAAELPSGKEEN
jgi:WXG100 family type VII secretion target